MLRYVIKRLLYMIPTLFGMSMIAFLIIQLPPGDYLTSMIASMEDSGQNVDPAQMARLREIYGFDDSIVVQYWNWISGILFRGDFGFSFEWNRPVERADLGTDGLDACHLRGLAALRLGRGAADRHLFGDAPPFDRRPRLHLPRLPRARHPEFHPRADADVPDLPLPRAERGRALLAGIRQGSLDLGQVRRPAGASLDPGHRHRHRRAPPR